MEEIGDTVADEEFKAVGAMVTIELFEPLGATVMKLLVVAAGVLGTVGSMVIKGALELGAAEERNDALDCIGECVGARIRVGAGVERSFAAHSR